MVVYGLVIAACLGLAQLCEVILNSFAEYSHGWDLSGLNPASPYQCAWWLVYSLAIGLVFGVAVTLYHRWGIGVFTSLAVSWIAGALILPIFIGGVQALWSGESLPYVLTLFMDGHSMPAYIFIALIATLLGLAVGKQLVPNVSDGTTPGQPLRVGFGDYLRKLFSRRDQPLQRSSF